MRIQADVDMPGQACLTEFQRASWPIRYSACLTSPNSSGSARAISWVDMPCLARSMSISALPGFPKPRVACSSRAGGTFEFRGSCCLGPRVQFRVATAVLDRSSKMSGRRSTCWPLHWCWPSAP